MKNTILKETLLTTLCVIAFIGSIFSSITIKNLSNKNNELRVSYKEQYNITRQIEMSDNVYIDGNGILKVK